MNTIDIGPPVRPSPTPVTPVGRQSPMPTTSSPFDAALRPRIGLVWFLGQDGQGPRERDDMVVRVVGGLSHGAPGTRSES